MKNKKVIIGLVVIAVFGLFAFYSFRSALNPYVTFREGAAMERTVQVMGYLEEGSLVYDLERRQLRFKLKDDEGTVALVAYEGARPNNMEDAESIAVIGQFEGEVFQARRILVKCPSKYEEEKRRE